jgi:glutathione S-transferase
MLKLCGFRISNYHDKVRLTLLEKGIEFEGDANCRPSQKEEWLARSPIGKVPILELDGARPAFARVNEDRESAQAAAAACART